MYLHHYMNGPAPYVSAAASDPFFASVVLLVINDNKASGTTTFVDQSNSAHSMTTGGSLAYSNVSAPTGMTTSALFNGTTQYLTTAAGADFAMGTGDWTIEGMFNFNSLAALGVMVDLRTASGTPSILSYNQSDATLDFSDNNSTTDRIKTSAQSTGSWLHVATVRSGNNHMMFVNGTQSGSTYTAANNYTDNGCFIGTYFGKNAVFMSAYCCCLRITKGVARYTSAFTPPTLPLPTQ